jgi:Amidohydrolase
VGADRLLLGTDFPYEAGDIFVRAVDYITDPRISRDEATAILETNAMTLFGITSPASGGTEQARTAGTAGPVQPGHPSWPARAGARPHRTHLPLSGSVASPVPPAI